MKVNKMILGLFLVFVFQVCNASEFNIRTEAVPGGIVAIPLNLSSFKMPEAFFKKKRLMVIRDFSHRDKWIAYTGIPLKSKPGLYSIRVKNNGGIFKQDFHVHNKKYATQSLVIKDKNKVSPNQKSITRIIREQREINKILSQWREIKSPHVNFVYPVKGRLSSPFGLRRIYNKKPRSPHSGIDLAAPKGTKIQAAENGVVIGIGDYFFTGNTVFIDHGQSLVTMYCHMDSVAVKVGETVRQGEFIGTLGMTGRATGPNLHWGVSLNNARVNPEYFVSGG